MGEFSDAYRRGRAEARAKYGPPPPFFRKKFAKPPRPAPIIDEEEASDDFDTGARPGVQDDEAIADLIEQSELLQAENDRLVAEVAALKATKDDDADSELVAKLRWELRGLNETVESCHNEIGKLKYQLTKSEEKREIAEQACADLREEIAELENDGRKRQGRGRA
jgi:predicted RNase H-like nuclease (RuvC/YqgF family)